jgi:Zn-dependent protease with chaperone function
VVAKRLGTTRITRARARWYLLRFGGPLALLPSLLQPAAVVVTGIVIAVLVHHPAPLVGVLLVLAIVAFRLRRRTYDADARTEPDVVALVRDVAARTGASPPDRIRIDAQPNAAFFRSPFSTRRELRLGLPLLAVVDRPALEAVVAHELAHGTQLVVRGFELGRDGLAERLVQTRRLVAATVSVDTRRALRPGSARARFLRETQPLAHAAEEQADALAVRVVGREATERALYLTAHLDLALTLYTGFVVLPLTAGGQRPSDPLAAFARWYRALDGRVLDRLDAVTEDDLLLDDHPLLANRAEGPPPAASGAPLGVRSRVPARDLATRAMLTRRLRRLPPTDDPAVEAWLRGAEVLRRQLVGSVRDVNDAVGLADHLAAGGTLRRRGNTDWLAVRVGLAVAFAVELADHGWRGPQPDTSVMLSPSGLRDDALAMAIVAIDDGEGAAPLVDALGIRLGELNTGQAPKRR